MRDLTTGLVMLAGIGLFLAVTWAGCSTFLKANDAYERGVAAALADPVVAKTLGAPVTESWFVNGSVEGDGMTSRGEWWVRLRGSERSGTLRIAGVESGGEWRVVAMGLKAGDEQIEYAPGRGFVAPDSGAPGSAPPDILSD